VCRQSFRQEATVGLLPLRFQLCAVAVEDPQARASLRGCYDRFTVQYRAAYERVLETWGREWRPPFTSVAAAAVFTALSEGLQIRRRADPELADGTLFANAVPFTERRLYVRVRVVRNGRSCTRVFRWSRGFGIGGALLTSLGMFSACLPPPPPPTC